MKIDQLEEALHPWCEQHKYTLEVVSGPAGLDFAVVLDTSDRRSVAIPLKVDESGTVVASVSDVIYRLNWFLARAPQF